MPVDPQFQSFLETMQSMPPLSKTPIFMLRWGMRPPPRGPAVASVRDLTIPSGSGKIRARHYRGADAARLPLILFFHGGGFVLGNLDTHDAICRELCRGTGAAVIAVDYRLAPEHKFPAATDDCMVALRWVAAHAADLGIDTARIAVAGDSAGGNLAAVTALRARDEDGPGLVGQVLIYPVTDHHSRITGSGAAFAEGPFLTRADMMFFTDCYTGRTLTDDPYAFPMQAPDLTRLPPALVITAEYDPLRDEGEAYGERLRAAGVETVITRYPGAIHGFFGIPGVDVARRAQAEAIAWLNRTLAAGGVSA